MELPGRPGYGIPGDRHEHLGAGHGREHRLALERQRRAGGAGTGARAGGAAADRQPRRADQHAQVAAGSTDGVATGDIALAYSCEAISVFQVSDYDSGTGVITHDANVSGQVPGNANDTVNYSYRRAVTHVVPVETVAYFIAPSARVSDASDPAPAGTTSLWRRRGLNPVEELVEGIEQIQVQYGVDTNGDVIVDEYRTANNVTDWNDVISVSVALLARSLEEYGVETDQRSYTLLDVTVAAPGDRRLREVFTATASIRNRVRVN